MKKKKGRIIRLSTRRNGKMKVHVAILTSIFIHAIEELHDITRRETNKIQSVHFRSQISN